MSQPMTLELDQLEREILLKGLKFVRSSLRLHVEDPTEENERLRRNRIDEVQHLIDRLEGSAHKAAAAV